MIKYIYIYLKINLFYIKFNIKQDIEFDFNSWF